MIIILLAVNIYSFFILPKLSDLYKVLMTPIFLILLVHGFCISFELFMEWLKDMKNEYINSHETKVK